MNPDLTKRHSNSELETRHSKSCRVRSSAFRRSRLAVRLGAFSLIELSAVLGAIALLTLALAPAVVRQLDRIASDQETAALKFFGAALQQSIQRNRSIPSHTNWVTTVAL